MHRIWLFAMVATFVAASALAQEDAATEPTEGSADVQVAEEAAPEPDTAPASDDAEPTEPSGPVVGSMPALRGYTGLFHLSSARSTPKYTFTLGLFGEWFTASDVVRAGDENTRFSGRFSLSFAAHDNVEVFTSLMASGNVNTFASPQLIQSLGDIVLGAKGFGAINEGLSAGGGLTLIFLNGSNDVGFDFSATSLDLRAMLDYDFRPAQGFPMVLYFNAAFILDNSSQLFDVELQRVERFAHQVSDFHFFELGLGFEFPLPWVTPHLEWNLGIPIGPGDEQECATNPIPCPHDAGFGSFPDILTIGLRATPVDALALMLGVDIGLTTEEATGLPAVPPYSLIFGLAYNLDPIPDEVEPAAPPVGWILGEIVAEETGEPIAEAVVQYPGTGLSAQLSDPTSGRFQSYEFPVGTEISVEVTHPMYVTRSFSRIIPEGQDGIRIRLEPAITLLSGRITDTAGAPVAAAVYVDGAESFEVEVDSATGELELELDEGEYVVTAIADDFVTHRERVTLGPGINEWQIDLQPLPDGQVAVLDRDSIRLTGRRISFIDNGTELDPDCEYVLAQVVELLRENPDLSVQVVAHGDDSATVDITTQQAIVVVEYLTRAGIEPSRLTSEGAGGSRPKYPNITPRNRSLNWRVEFDLEIPGD